MNKLSAIIAHVVTVGAIILVPVAASAQDEKQSALERDFYSECYTKKDKATCLPLARELAEKYPTSQYVKFAHAQIKGDLSEKFQGALSAFYAGPDAPKLDQLIQSADNYLAKDPGQTALVYVTARIALATTYGVMGGIFKDTDKAKTSAERALQLMADPKPPEGWDPKDYDPLRETALAQLNQFLGYNILQGEGDSAQAVEFLNKAIAVKQKDGLGWKDPNNYWLRSNASFKQYQKLSKDYQALSDEQKTGEEGKTLLNTKINPTIDRMISDYARVLATATNPATQPIKDAAKEQFDSFWKYRTGVTEGAAEFVKKFEADPTIEDQAVPAKAETTVSADAPPAGAAGAPKLTTAVTAATGAASTQTKAAAGKATTGKAAAGKGKAAPRKRR
jgi:tetratricopeptide (TPR) repeat protein